MVLHNAAQLRAGLGAAARGTEQHLSVAVYECMFCSKKCANAVLHNAAQLKAGLGAAARGEEHSTSTSSIRACMGCMECCSSNHMCVAGH
jgi:hypothetical protein